MENRLSARADLIYRMCAQKIFNCTFDGRDIERFLLYGRDFLREYKWLHEFADGLAHSVRNRGAMYEVVSQISGLTREEIREMNSACPLGHVGIHLDALHNELNGVLSKVGVGCVSMDVVRDFALCLILMANEMVFDINDLKIESQTADVIIIKSQVSLAVGCEGRFYINMLCIPNKYIEMKDEYSILIPGESLLEAIRDESGNLEVAVYGTPRYASDDVALLQIS